jgi:hypothetical protein
MKPKKLNEKAFHQFVKEVVEFSHDKLYCIIDVTVFDFTEEQIVMLLEMNAIFKRKRTNYRIMVNDKEGVPIFDVNSYNLEEHVDRMNDVLMQNKVQHGIPIEVYYKDIYEKYRLLFQ